MFARDTTSYAKFETIYKDIVAEGRNAFLLNSGSVTVFHEILLDRVADAYVVLLMGEQSTHHKGDQEKLQKWVNISLSELHSSVNETKSRRNFYHRLAEAVKLSVPDLSMRKRILDSLHEIVKKNKEDFLESSDES